LTFYVLINTDNEERIQKELSKVLKDVKFEYESVYGVYDGVLKIYGKNNNLREIADKIKTLPKIHSTMILTVG